MQINKTTFAAYSLALVLCGLIFGNLWGSHATKSTMTENQKISIELMKSQIYYMEDDIYQLESIVKKAGLVPAE